jgi:anaerobic dimethyl sulfoxide reductase subunit A
MSQSATEQRIPFTCSLDCGSRCELVAVVRDGQLVRVDTPPGRPDTVERPRLIPCTRGRALGRARSASTRALYPHRKRGDGFVRVSWDEALDAVAERLQQVRARYGDLAVLHASGAGSISGRGFSGAAASRRFFLHWGAVSETSGNMSNHCVSVAADWMLGRRLPGSDRATLLDSRLIILWGHNPAETHHGPNTAHFIAAARERGARVVLIDPRYTDTGILADQWVPIRPGTDAAMAAAMAYVLETEGLVDHGFVERCTTGYAPYRDYLLGETDGTPKTPAWAEAETGVAAETIAELARAYGTLKPAALLPGWGPQRGLSGEQIARAWIALACLSGNVGLRGGGLASVGTRQNILPVGALPSGPHRAARQLSNVTWAREILDGQLQPPISMAYIVASNLINRSPNTQANARALEQLDFVVVQDPYWTPTAQYADLVLPICTDLERSDLVTSWGQDVHLFDSRQAVEPVGEARTDYWVFSQLAERLGFGEAYTQGKTEAEWLQRFRNPRTLDLESLDREGIMRGPRGTSGDGEPRVALADFRRDPKAHPLSTPSGLIELAYPQAEAYGLPAVPSYVAVNEREEEMPLYLLTPHFKYRSNSCLAGVSTLKRLEPPEVWINPVDAAARGIAHGQGVEVFNAQGTVRVPAKVTERIMPGVVCLYQGAWYRRAASGGDVDEGGCANVLTAHRRTPTGGMATHTTRVDVRATKDD